jgi:hypothetical protein
LRSFAGNNTEHVLYFDDSVSNLKTRVTDIWLKNQRKLQTSFIYVYLKR